MAWSFCQCPLCLFLVLAVGLCTPDGEETEDGAQDRVVPGSKARMEREAGVVGANSADRESASDGLFPEKELDLYGEMIDQDGYPVLGASVRLAVHDAGIPHR